MPFQPFQSELCDHRAVRIPADLSPEARERFVAKIGAAVRQQAALAGKCGAILAVRDAIVERDDLLLIPHEPAFPIDPDAAISAEQRPDITTVWWLTWATVRTLRAAAEESIPHGGIQLRSLLMDRAGRIKLTDFGVGPAFETVCGLDSRRQVVCDGPDGNGQADRAVSAVWALLGEDASREYGWIAPYFGHELLEGKVRLNPKSDQFSLGALLFLLTTGSHPYGAELSDPTLNFYFHLEPYNLQDEREDWAEAFERQEKQLARADDQPVLLWSQLIRRLLASDPGERFPNPAEIATFGAEQMRSDWDRAAAAIQESLRLLDEAEIEGFLEKIGSWKESEALPALWREKLGAWVGEVEAQKEVIGQRKRLEQRMREAQEALNDLEVAKAKTIADEIAADEQAAEALRSEARELAALCDEQEQFVISGADELAKHYLDSAQAAVEKNDFNDARQYLEVVLQDPGMPVARKSLARKLGADVELAEQRVQRQLDALTTATEELREGHYAAARQRLEALTSDADTPKSVAEQARLLLEDVSATEARHAEYAQTLDEARAAWERGDAEALAEKLAAVPEDVSHAQIADVRGDLATRGESLQMALEHKRAAEQALAADDLDAALAAARQAAGVVELPQLLQDGLTELIGQCEQRLAEERAEALAKAAATLAEARGQYESGDLDASRGTLKSPALAEDWLPEELQAGIRELTRSCARAGEATEQLEQAAGRLEGDRVDDADDLLGKLETEGLPQPLVERAAELRERAAQTRERLSAAERKRLAGRLNEAETVLAAGELDQADTAVGEVEKSRFVDDALRDRIRGLRSRISEHRPTLEALKRADAAVSAAGGDVKQAESALGGLPEQLPDWAAKRAEKIRSRMREIQDQRRRELIRGAQAALDGAEAALGKGDCAAARSHLDEARAGVELESELEQRSDELADRAAALETWLPKVAALAAALERDEVAAVFRDAGELLKDDAVPELAGRRLAALRDEAKQRIAARREQIKADLEKLAADLEARGRRAKDFVRRVQAMASDELATREQRKTAAELEKKFEALPPLKPSPVPKIVAAAIAVVSIAAAAWYFTRPTLEQRLLRAQARLQTNVVQLAQQAAADFRRPAEYTLRFDSLQALPATLIAEDAADGQTVELASVDDPSQIAGLAPADDWMDKLFPLLPDAEVIDAERQRLARELAEAEQRAATEGRVANTYTLRIEKLDGFPTRVLAMPADANKPRETHEIGAPQNKHELSALKVSDALFNRLFPRLPDWTIDKLVKQVRPIAERILSAAAQRAANEDRDVSEYTLDIKPLNDETVAVFARGPRPGDEFKLWEIARDDDLGGLQLTLAQFEELFPRKPPPPPDFGKISAEYVGRLGGIVGANVEFKADLGGDGKSVRLTASTGGVSLVAPSGVVFQGGAITPPADQIARHFRVQADAVAALSAPDGASFAVDSQYDERLRALGDELEIVAAPAAGAVDVRVAVRLDGDPRGERRVELTGRFDTKDNTLRADAAGAAAFGGFIRQLQGDRLDDSEEQILKTLALPKVLSLSSPQPFGGGEQASFRLAARTGSATASLAGHWNPSALLYEVDEQDAQNGLRTVLDALAGDKGTMDTLARTWAGVRSKLAPPAGAPGSGYWKNTELRTVAVAGNQPDEPYVVVVQASGGPTDLTSNDDQVAFAARLKLTDEGLVWDETDLDGARGEVFAGLTRLAGDEAFRARRERAALAELTKQLGANAGGQREGAKLVADVGGRQFEAQWDAAALRYGDWNELKRAALETLAGAAEISIDDFVAVLDDVTRRKIAGFGAAEYQPVAVLANESKSAAARLIAISSSLQSLLAPDPEHDRYPTVFIEYFIDDQAVYGLSWRIETEQDRVARVTGTDVWQVMDIATLRAFATPLAFRNAYSTDATLGQNLLGRALGDSPRASDSGAFGVAIAPAGLLWLTRWEQVLFPPRSVSGLDLGGAADPGAIESLRELLKKEIAGRNQFRWRKAGIWCLPCLAGEWIGDARRIRLNVGEIVPGKAAKPVSFNKLDGHYLGAIQDATLRAELQWGRFRQGLPWEDVGHKFWDRGWSGDRWNPLRITSVSAIQVRP